MKYLGDKKFDWFESLLNFSGTTLPLIRKDVRSIKEDHRSKNKGKDEKYIAGAVSKELISKCTIKAGSAGGLTSVPATIPGIGTIGTIILGATADLTYLIKLHIELCYGIAAAYEVQLTEDELRAVTLAILGFTGSSQALKGLTAGMIKRSVDDTAGVYLKKGLAKSSAEVAEKLLPRLLGRGYKVLPFLGIPIGISINAISTMLVGKRARQYFSSWDETSRGKLVIDCHLTEEGNFECK